MRTKFVVNRNNAAHPVTPVMEPKNGEKRQKFVGRCMKDSAIKKRFPDNTKRMQHCALQFKGNDRHIPIDPKPAESKADFVQRCIVDTTVQDTYSDATTRTSQCELHFEAKTTSTNQSEFIELYGVKVNDGLKTNPFPNEHAIRLRNPDDFDSKTFRRTSGSGKGRVQGVKIKNSVDVIWAKLKGKAKSDDPVIAQALRFPIGDFTAVQAKKFIKDNEIKGTFEAASKKKNASNDIRVIQVKVLMSELIRHAVFEGRKQLVMPTVLLVEGVHKGIFYSKEELSKFPESWNGIPVSVAHPEYDGRPVSCNSPEIIEKQTVGRLFNCLFEDGKLKGEVWLDIVKSNDVEPDIIKQIQENKQMEVSTGLFVEEIEEAGEWNGEEFESVATNFRPDHLALLPHGIGACSCADGCGTPRMNEDGEEIEDNELGHDTIRMKLFDELHLANKPRMDEFIGILDVFEKFFIWRFSDPETSTLFKQNFSIDKDDRLALKGEPIEVKEKVEFVPVKKSKTAAQRNKDNEEEEKNTERSPEMERKERIDALIASGIWGNTEATKEYLAELQDSEFDHLEKLTANKAAGEGEQDGAGDGSGQGDAGKVADNKNEGKGEGEGDEEGDEEDKPRTVEEYIGLAPDEMKDVLQSGLQMHRSNKKKLVDELTANKRNKFTKEELDGKSIGELEKLAELGQVEVNYEGRSTGGSFQDNDEQDAVPEMPKMKWNVEPAAKN